MSHISKISLQVRNLRALAAAAKQFGGELVLDQQQFEYFAGSKGKCNHAIRVPGTKYEVGIVKQADGSFELQCDFWASGGLGRMFGNRGEKLKQAYATQLAKQYWTAKGYRITENKKADGTVVLVAEQ